MKSVKQAEKAKRLLNEALLGVNQARNEWAENPLDFTDEEELASFYHKLSEMKDSLDKNEPVNIFGLWRIVTDRWPFTDKLRNKIVEAELEYERLYG